MSEVAFFTAVFMRSGKCSVLFFISESSVLISPTVFTKFDFAVPRVIETYFSARASYTVLITFDFAVMPNAECLIVTVSQRETLSKIAEYSGCFQSGSNSTVSVGVSTPSGFSFIYDSAFVRRVF